MDYVRLAGQGALVANVMSVPLTLIFSVQGGTSMDKAIAMALKSALGGPVALLEYRLNGAFDNGGRSGSGGSSGQEEERRQESI